VTSALPIFWIFRQGIKKPPSSAGLLEGIKDGAASMNSLVQFPNKNRSLLERRSHQNPARVLPSASPDRWPVPGKVWQTMFKAGR